MTADDAYVVVGARWHERVTAVTRGGAISGQELEKDMSKEAATLLELRRDVGRGLRFGPGFSGNAMLPQLGPAQTFMWDEAEQRFIPGPTMDEVENAQQNAIDAIAARNAAVAARDAAIQARDDADDAAIDAEDFAGKFITAVAEPTERANGDNLIAGDYWFKPTTRELHAWDGAAWAPVLNAAATITLSSTVGDGGTSYTLDPLAQAGNTHLTIGGLSQGSGYTLVDGALTVTGGVPAGLSIFAVIFETSVIGATNGLLVRLSDAGGYFTTKTVEGALQQLAAALAAQIALTAPFIGSAPARPEDYGAVGNGIANDTAAVQAALNAGRAEIRFDQVYSVDALTLASANKLLFGRGELRSRDDSTNLLNGTGLSETVFAVDLFGSASLNTTSISGNDAIRLTDCTDIVIERCKIERFRTRPVLLQGGDRIRIQAALFKNNNCGPRAIGVTDYRIIDNTFDGTCLAASEFTTGIGLESTDGWGRPVCRDVVIRGNLTKNIVNAQAILVHGGINVTITENTCLGAFIGISLNPYNSTDNIFYPVVSKNRLEGYTGAWDGTGTGNSQLVLQAGGATPNIVGAIVTDNNVRNGNRSKAGASEGGIQVGWCDDLMLSGNVVQSSWCNGIRAINCSRANFGPNIINTVVAATGEQYSVRATGCSGLLHDQMAAAAGTIDAVGMTQSDNLSVA